MKVVFLPKTNLGNSSVVLILLMFLLFRVGFFVTRNFYPNVSAGRTIIEDIVSRPAVSVPMLTGYVSGIAAFITGVKSIFKRNERSLLVYISAIIGVLLVIFLFGEIFSPH